MSMITIMITFPKNYTSQAMVSNYSNNSSYNKLKNSLLEIPKIGLSCTLLKADDDFGNLDNGLVYYNQLNPQDKIIIFGHSGMGRGVYFNRLDVLKVGDVATLFIDGKSYAYLVEKTYLIDETEVDVLDDEENSGKLLLITCDKTEKRKRLVVALRLRYHL